MPSHVQILPERWRLLAAWLVGSVALAAHAAAPAKPDAFFQKYCFECHGATKPKAGLSLEKLTAHPSFGTQADEWSKVAEALEARDMPPDDATEQPAPAERAAATTWIRSTLHAYETEHGGEPGVVTVRRLTSGEYAYALRDLTGVELKVGIDASSDSVGGEGFTNFGDVQFVQDASLERYLESAKAVADHAVVGAGPLRFSPDIGRSGVELAALNRINELYAANGFRVVSGEGGAPFGVERYGKAFYIAWHFKHRVALGEPKVTLRELAAREGITNRFAEHIWSVVNRPTLNYPAGEFVAKWKALPAPTSPADAKVAIEKARSGCDEIYKAQMAWPVWFFARGQLASAGAGDESPLVFDDTSLMVEPTHHYTYALGGARFGFGRGGFGGGGFGGGGGAGARGGAAPAAGGATKVVLSVTNINPSSGAQPVVIWRNPRIVTHAAPPGGGRGPNAAAAANAGGRARVPAGPVLSEKTLRSVLPADTVLALAFGKSPDGAALGPDDIAVTGTLTLEIPSLATAPGTSAALEFDAELGADRNGVARLLLSNSEEVPARGAVQGRAFLGDPASAGYKSFRAAIAEYLALLPPNSHGEANPADKDPAPLPFDSTYNTPEHDAFLARVKYNRTDAFFTANVVEGPDRDRLNQAWNDLTGTWPYHNEYLGLLAEHYKVDLKGAHIADMTAARIAALPAEMQPYVAKVRASYDEVTKALKAAEPGHIDDALAFASRAWRRPLTSAEKTRLKAFYQRSRSEGKMEHDAAIRALLARILVAPSFLYRVEGGVAKKEQPLDNWELASRMSFFLWSSIPDDELRRAAAAGELSQPAQLARQVRRMVADPKARRVATEFFGQWLGFYRFDEYRGVDTTRFPEFTEEVQDAMYDQAVSTFEYLVREGRPLRELVDADYTFLNQPLAKFYGIDREVNSKDDVVRVDGAHAFNRGGALRLGAVLTATSGPLRSSPVKRGDWILRRILGTPTPPPPGDAGALPADPKAFGGVTLRERLAEHKKNPTCAACHLKIDPLGFPLERFDGIGRTREKYQDGAVVDVTGEFADKTTLKGPEDLLAYLKAREPQVMKTFSKKLLGYALGRTVLSSDRALVEDMTAGGGAANFADLAVKIVSSRQFRNRQGEDKLAEVPVPTTHRTLANSTSR